MTPPPAQSVPCASGGHHDNSIFLGTLVGGTRILVFFLSLQPILHMGTRMGFLN